MRTPSTRRSKPAVRAPRARVPSATVLLEIQGGPWRGVSGREIRRRAAAMLAELALGDAEVSIVLTGDDQIHILNRDYRGKDRPTDVLAFAMREGEHGDLAGPVLGDVVISVPTARRQAEERGVAPLEEVTMLLAHGLLHLLGWDHDTPAKDRAMRRQTGRLVSAASPSPSPPRPRRRPATGRRRARS